MHVTDINISRLGYNGYGQPDLTKPFLARVGVVGQHCKVELHLSADMSARIVDIIADEVAAAGRATADAMVASCLAVQAKPAITNGEKK